ncbi:hypothetical protein E4T50_15221 [Aureobasidium sp. EXF-12298]|nr:hypothetical protein E4T50_15221 [Aureobasidium sp. EXF-12298]
MAKSPATLPRFNELPDGSAWGVWDTEGHRDALGTLNHLTSETKTEAAKEVQDGITYRLSSWALDKPHRPVFGRQQPEHKIVDNSLFSQSMSFDDVLSFNTQSSSQWDGLRHVIHRQTGLLYNGVTKDEVFNTTKLGLQSWHEIGGIVGRGVLIDYVAYAARHKIEYSPTDYHAITLQAIQQAAEEQGVEFRRGDILLVRSGLIKWYNDCEDHKSRDEYFVRPDKKGVGVAPDPETVAWVWNQGFAAVAGDALAWEPIPYPASSPPFHQYLLALWGTPIGELWDLEGLARICAKLGRYSFFLSSIPLNVPGGVASPPNALAVF